MFYPKDNQIYDELWDVVPVVQVNKGDPAVVQDVFGFYYFDTTAVQLAAGQEVTFIYKQRQTLADKVVGTGEEILAGDRVYHIVALNAISATPVGVIGVDSYFCGWAKKNAAAEDTTVLINFDGTRYDQLV